MMFRAQWTILALVLALMVRAGMSGAAVLPKDRIDAQVKPVVDGQYCVGLVVGVIDSTGQHVFAYGKTSLQGARAPDGDTIFEIGPVTKTFTATLLAQMVEAGEVKLVQPVEELLPADLKVPSEGGSKILLVHLAAQTSALPGEAEYLVPKNPANPYADYTQEQLKAFLGRFVMPRPPGARYENSNLGYGLLGQALAAKAGKPYEQLVIDRVCGPLEMKQTRVALSDEMEKNLAQGYDAEVDPIGTWDMPLFQGAAALKSSMNDLMKYAAAQAGITHTALEDAITMTHVYQTDVDRQNEGGLGWKIGHRFNVVWEYGQTGGYSAFIGSLPRFRSAVVVLANTATPIVNTIGINLVKELAGTPADRPRLQMPVKMDSKTMDELVGQYEFNKDFSMALTRQGNQLYAQATGQPPHKVFARADGKLFFRKLDATMSFQRGGDGKATEMILEQEGRRLVAKKVK
jgi:D-alanyl-D-alanine-carboxypeptidase/D-alanyl-D-alanine-endopeptidase